MKPCPFCAEKIQEAAIKCKHCGSDLVTVGSTKKKSGCLPKIGMVFGFFMLVGLIGGIVHPNKTTTADGGAPSPTVAKVASVAKKSEPSIKLVHIRSQGQADLFWVDPKQAKDPHTMRAALKEYADENRSEWCHLAVWTNRKRVPKSWPMTDAEVNAQVGVYERNRATGLDHYLVMKDGDATELP